MGIQVEELATRIDTIDEFVRRTLDSGKLGCDKTFIRTNMFCMDESILLPHHWDNYTDDRFRDFCRNGNTYLQDPVNIPLMFQWKLLYKRYRAYMFLEHYDRTANRNWFLKMNYQKGPYSISYKMGLTIIGKNEIFYTKFFMDTDKTYFIHQEDK